MMIRRLKSLLKRQAGFTLIEVLVTIAITGIIALGASVSAGQMIIQTSRDRDYTLASRYVTNAIYWISHDALMAQRIQGYSGFPLTNDLSLGWTSWDSIDYSVNYTLENGTLKRICSDNGNTTTITIAQNINSAADKTFCSLVDGVISITVTCSIGEGSKIVEVTRNKEITSRPKL